MNGLLELPQISRDRAHYRPDPVNFLSSGEELGNVRSGGMTWFAMYGVTHAKGSKSNSSPIWAAPEPSERTLGSG